MNSALTVALPEAAKRTTEGQKAGPIGLAVILILCIACYFLFKSMSKHLKKVRDEFPTDAPTAARTTPAARAARVELVKTKATDPAGRAAGTMPGDPSPAAPSPAAPSPAAPSAAAPSVDEPGNGPRQTSG